MIDSSGGEVTALSDGADVKARAEVSGGIPAKALVLTLARYNDDGALLGCETAELRPFGGGNAAVETGSVMIGPGTAYVKAFLWERGSMAPLLPETRIERAK